MEGIHEKSENMEGGDTKAWKRFIKNTVFSLLYRENLIVWISLLCLTEEYPSFDEDNFVQVDV